VQNKERIQQSIFFFSFKISRAMSRDATCLIAQRLRALGMMQQDAFQRISLVSIFQPENTEKRCKLGLTFVQPELPCAFTQSSNN